MDEMYTVMNKTHNYCWNIYAKQKRQSVNTYNFDPEYNEDFVLWEDEIWNAVMYFMEEDFKYYEKTD